MAIRAPFVAGTESYDVEEFRVANAAHWTPATNAYKILTGILPGPNNPGVVTATGTPNGFVHVAPAIVVIQSSRAANAGAYTLTWDADVDINILSTPANATNPRNDLIIAHCPDSFYGDANSTPVVRQVVGTPSGSPSDPSLAAFPDAVTLARVRVNASATTITSGNITDLRPVHTVARGGVLPTATATTRNALTGLYDGLTIYRRDRDWVEIYDGTAWRVQGVGIVSSTGDLSAITNPHTGQLAYNTGDALMYRYTGSAWRAQGLWSTTTTLGSSTGTVTFTVPTYLRTLTLTWTARTDASAVTSLNMRINSDATTSYFGTAQSVVSGTSIPIAYAGQTSARIGVISGSTTGAGKFGYGTTHIAGWNATGAYLGFTYTTGMYDSPSSVWTEQGQGIYFVSTTHTTISILAQSGLLIAGSRFTLTGNE